MKPNRGISASHTDYEFKEHTSGRWRRAWVLAAAAAGIALLAAACGGGGGGSSATGETAYQKALAYAQCMRAHGEPSWPDPDSRGNFIINGKQQHLNGALMNSANKACQHLMPESAPLTAAQQRQAAAQALKFAECMRSHGLPTFPDPSVNSQGVGIQLPRGVRPGSPVFQAAQRACRNLMPGLGGGGP